MKMEGKTQILILINMFICFFEDVGVGCELDFTKPMTLYVFCIL